MSRVCAGRAVSRKVCGLDELAACKGTRKQPKTGPGRKSGQLWHNLWSALAQFVSPTISFHPCDQP